jgi:tetrahydromethanopterin S-methyltransferase subunit B
MTATFIGGAAGSTTGSITYQLGGWRATAATGFVIGVVLLGLLALEIRSLAIRRRSTP